MPPVTLHTRETDDAGHATATSGRADVLAVLCPAFLPWSVQTFEGGGLTWLFPWGLVNTDPVGVTNLYDFLFRFTVGLPDYILAWPVSVGLYALAVASAVVGWRTGREDVRVTAGLLVVAGVAQLTVAQGFSVQPGRVAYPTGTVALWAVAWWRYWPTVRARVSWL